MGCKKTAIVWKTIQKLTKTIYLLKNPRTQKTEKSRQLGLYQPRTIGLLGVLSELS